MTEDWLTALAASPFALPLLFALVLGDAFLVVVPGEAAVTAFGALAVSTGAPPLPAVVAVAAVAAACGDACCYLAGRVVGLRAVAVDAVTQSCRTRSRGPTGACASGRPSCCSRPASFPFARLAVNLVAGASRVPAPRYLAVAAVAALAWALYQALLGAVVAAILPGGAGARGGRCRSWSRSPSGSGLDALLGQARRR